MRPGARASGLPLGLERYNVVYMVIVGAIVLGGTLYSIIYMTHHYNVILSDPMGAFARSQAQAQAGKVGQSELESLNELFDASANMPGMPGTLLADRKNWINRIFVKMAWLWTTAAFLLQAATLRNMSTVSASTSTAATNGQVDDSMAKEAKSSSTFDDGSASRRGKGRGDAKANSTRSPIRDPAGVQATVMGAASLSLLRYAIATMLWVLFARWFFGPALMERVRSVSGGVCTPMDQVKGVSKGTSKATLDALQALLPSRVDSQHCYAGGRLISAHTHPDVFAQAGLSQSDASQVGVRASWQGGHDISGHTFVLIISTLYLLEEITPFLPYLLPATLQSHITRLLPRSLWAPANPFTIAGAGTQERAHVNKIAIATILALVGIWTLSLLVTSIFFHTPQEKISGLILALVCSLAIPKGG